MYTLSLNNDLVLNCLKDYPYNQYYTVVEFNLWMCMKGEKFHLTFVKGIIILKIYHSVFWGFFTSEWIFKLLQSRTISFETLLLLLVLLFILNNVPSYHHFLEANHVYDYQTHNTRSLSRFSLRRIVSLGTCKYVLSPFSKNSKILL